MKKNDIEDLFKDSFKDFEAEVSPGVWSNIQTALKGIGIGLLGKALLNKIGTSTIVAVVSSAAAVISTVVIMNLGGKSQPKPGAETKQPVAGEQHETVKPLAPQEIKEFLTDNTSAQSNTPAVKENTLPAESGKAQKTDKSPTHIKKEKMKEVISQYSDHTIASISASPIGGTVPLIVNVSNSGTGKVNKWDFGDGQKETGANPVHVYDIPGIYTISLTSTGPDGKISTDSVKIEVFGNSSISSVPTTFSPNGDGSVDVFKVNSQDISNMDVVIFDKTGTTIYKWQGTKGQWDGKDLEGKPAKEGIYFFIINAIGIDGKKYDQKGTIKLTR
ncbi:MAG TPA: gliding motility-associated C-terminal domain-containing protein [Bacteroidia bacterium]|jgi:gliding motility-associated-like protein